MKVLRYTSRTTTQPRPDPPNPNLSFGILPNITFSLYINMILFTKTLLKARNGYIKSKLEYSTRQKLHHGPQNPAPSLPYRTVLPLPYPILPYPN